MTGEKGRLRKCFDYLRRKSIQCISTLDRYRSNCNRDSYTEMQMNMGRKTSDEILVPCLQRRWDYQHKRTDGRNPKIELIVQEVKRGRTPHRDCYLPPYIQALARRRENRGNGAVGRRLADSKQHSSTSLPSHNIYWDYWDLILAIVYFDDGLTAELIDIRRIREPLSLPSERYKPLEENPIGRRSGMPISTPPSWTLFWDFWDSTITVVYSDDGTNVELLEIRRIRGFQPLPQKRFKPLEEKPLFKHQLEIEKPVGEVYKVPCWYSCCAEECN